MSGFINFTNHSSDRWNEKQLSEAKKYGNITDIPFPSISPTISEKELLSLAEDYTEKILSHEPSCVLCQGESVFSTLMVTMLIKRGIETVAAASTRKVTETVSPDGKTIKNAVFEFECFRKYIIV